MDKHSDTLRYPPHIIAILRRLQEAHTILSVRLEGKRSIYNSILLDLDSQASVLYLDDIGTPQQQLAIERGTLLLIETKLDGVKLSFTTTVQNVFSALTGTRYQTSLPEQLIYKQRRRHYRAALDNRLKTTVTFPLNQQPICGQLVDISVGGICSRIDYSVAKPLMTVQAIQQARITLPGSAALTVDLALRSIRHFPDQGYSLVGSEFLGISPNEQHHVERVVARLDREYRRTSSPTPR